MVKLFLDGADLNSMADYYPDGYTTNPSLMRKAGIKHYGEFAKALISGAIGKPISFEVLADDLPTMDRQAREIASWGESVYVKIPVTTTSGDSTALLIHLLAADGIKVNVTAVMTLEQIRTVARVLTATPAIISIFAGRIADTQKDPTPLFTEAQRVKHANTEILWASTREVFNVKQAEGIADIITLSPELFSKLNLKGKDLKEYSRETVCQFYKDAQGIEL